MARPDRPLLPGDRLGPYELVRLLGEGGFAAVWLARRVGPGGFEVKVAIKVIRAALANHPGFKNMFMDEAKVLAGIDHPNVVKTFELGLEGDTLYMAMEYVNGKALNVLRDCAAHEHEFIPAPILMRILADTCAGLHAAHELTRDGKPLNVIHRDISPENVLITDQGQTKLIDFGIAKAADRLAGDTATGLAKGKVRYMSPEQATGRPLDRRADIWALGAVAYELLTGRAPFDAENDMARLYALAGTMPVPELQQTVPAALRVIVQRALSRDLDERFATAAEMRAALENALDEQPERVTTDTVAAFFSTWIKPQSFRDAGTLDEPPSEGRILRRKLAGSAAVVTTGTRELGPDDVVQSQPIETFSAMNSAITNRGRSRRAATLLLAIFGLAAGITGVLAIRASQRSAPGAPNVVSSPAMSVVATAPVLAASEVPLSPPDVSLDATDAAAQNVSPSPDEKEPRADKSRTSRPRTLPKKPRPARPKYDDTIQ
jgi:serine/threonine-protein kinase